MHTHDYPFEFTTEASINMSDDHELLGLMRDAGFTGIFVGIEIPDTDTLIDMQKKQNTRRGIAESVERSYNAAIFVMAGFVVGFDSEKGSVEEGMVRIAEETSIPIAIVSLLRALPNTQLSRRLEKEDRRLDFEAIATYEDRRGDLMTSGVNFVTKRPRREVLVDYRNVLERLFEPEAYFNRVQTMASKLWPVGRPARVHRRTLRRELFHLVRLLSHITLKRPDMRGPFWRTLWWTLRNRSAATWR